MDSQFSFSLSPFLQLPEKAGFELMLRSASDKGEIGVFFTDTSTEGQQSTNKGSLFTSSPLYCDSLVDDIKPLVSTGTGLFPGWILGYVTHIYNTFAEADGQFDDKCITSNPVGRSLFGASRNPSTSLLQSCRKLITFDEDESSNSQPTPFTPPSFQTILFDTNNNPNNSQSNRGTGTSRASTFVKEEHDSPRNGVRKDVKLISDAAEPEELFGMF